MLFRYRGERREEEERNGMTGRIEALRGKGRRVMRSRLVHEWRGVVGGWYFVPFQTRRKPRRQDFGVRLKSCRLNLRSPGQSSIHRNPSIVFPRVLLLFKALILLAAAAVNFAVAVFCHGKARRGKSSEASSFLDFYFDRRTMECLRNPEVNGG